MRCLRSASVALPLIATDRGLFLQAPAHRLQLCHAAFRVDVLGAQRSQCRWRLLPAAVQASDAAEQVCRQCMQRVCSGHV
jgi:hypothetical protein